MQNKMEFLLCGKGLVEQIFPDQSRVPPGLAVLHRRSVSLNTELDTPSRGSEGDWAALWYDKRKLEEKAVSEGV